MVENAAVPVTARLRSDHPATTTKETAMTVPKQAILFDQPARMAKSGIIAATGTPPPRHEHANHKNEHTGHCRLRNQRAFDARHRREKKRISGRSIDFGGETFPVVHGRKAASVADTVGERDVTRGISVGGHPSARPRERE